MCEIEHIELFAALAAPFAEQELRKRPAKGSGKDLTYVTARAVMNRLDEALGPSGWWDEYRPFGENGVLCRLTIRLPDGVLLAKEDVGGISVTSDPSDTEKSGVSDAFKRAAVKFGVGRYLYGDGVPPSIREVVMAGLRRSRPGPSAEMPERDALPAPAPAPPTGPREDRPPRDDRPGPPPKTGKALFGWLKDRDERHGSDLLAIVTDWGRDNGFPPRVVQWSAEQVDQAHTEALRLLAGPAAGYANHGAIASDHAPGARR